MIWLLVGNEKKRTTLYVFHFNQDITVVLVKNGRCYFIAMDKLENSLRRAQTYLKLSRTLYNGDILR